MSATTSSDVIVVGAGVIGLAIAEALSADGRRVHVLDRRDPHLGGASVANAGWLNPYTLVPLPSRAALRMGLTSFAKPASPLYIRPRPSIGLASWLLRFAGATNARRHDRGRQALVALGHDGARRYLELADDVVGLQQNSDASLNIFATETGAAQAVLTDLAPIEGAGPVPEYELLTGSEARAAEPLLTDRVGSALRIHGDLQLEPDTILTALIGAIRARGGRVDLDTDVLGLTRSGDRITGVRTAAGELTADTVIVAAGAWSPELLRPHGVRLRMEPGKGYSVGLRVDAAPHDVLAFAAEKVGAVADRGQIRLVGTMELSGVNERVDRRRVDAIVAAVRPYLAPLAEADEPSALIGEIRVGMRPMFAGGLPVMDRVDGLDGLWLSTGHGMMGVTLALSAAAALREYIDTGQRPAVLEPFRLAGA